MTDLHQRAEWAERELISPPPGSSLEDVSRPLRKQLAAIFAELRRENEGLRADAEKMETHVMVPREPTLNMIAAGGRRYSSRETLYPRPSGLASAIYKAMLAAAEEQKRSPGLAGAKKEESDNNEEAPRG